MDDSSGLLSTQLCAQVLYSSKDTREWGKVRGGPWVPVTQQKAGQGAGPQTRAPNPARLRPIYHDEEHCLRLRASETSKKEEKNKI